MREHLQSKHQGKSKNKNHSQLPLWGIQPTILSMPPKPNLLYEWRGECLSMGDKMFIDCIQQNLECIENMQTPTGNFYWLTCNKCQTKHQLPLVYGLVLDALSGNVPEQFIIDICD